MTTPPNNSYMALGTFVFNASSAPINKITRAAGYTWVSKQAIAATPIHQFNGVGEQKITLSGAIHPSIAGDEKSLDDLRAMAGQGKSWNLVDGGGQDLGAWFIHNIDQTGEYLDHKGAAQTIDFTINLTLAPDLLSLGTLGSATPQLDRIITSDGRVR